MGMLTAANYTKSRTSPIHIVLTVVISLSVATEGVDRMQYTDYDVQTLARL